MERDRRRGRGGEGERERGGEGERGRGEGNKYSDVKDLFGCAYCSRSTVNLRYASHKGLRR